MAGRGVLHYVPFLLCAIETAQFQRFAILVSEWSASGPAPTGRYAVTLRLWTEGGALRYVPRFPCDQGTAEFQRFVILESGWSVSDPTPTGRYARFFEVVVGKGWAPSCPVLLMQSENGGIPTIWDSGVGVAGHSILPQPARYARFSRLGPPGNGRTARAVRDGPAEGAYNASGADHETPHGRFRDPRHYPSEAPATRRRPFSRACAAPVSLRRPPPAPLQPGPCQARWNRSSQCLPPLWRTSWRPSRTCWPAWSDRR